MCGRKPGLQLACLLLACGIFTRAVCSAQSAYRQTAARRQAWQETVLKVSTLQDARLQNARHRYHRTNFARACENQWHCASPSMLVAPASAAWLAAWLQADTLVKSRECTLLPPHSVAHPFPRTVPGWYVMSCELLCTQSRSQVKKCTEVQQLRPPLLESSQFAR